MSALRVCPPFCHPTDNISHRRRYVEFDQDFIWVLIGPEQFAVGTLHTYCRHTGRFLWALSPLSETLRRRHSLYRFSPPSQSVIRGQPLSNAAQNKTVAPGRREQVVTKSASRVMPQLEGWDAIHPDAKTGCLCLLSSQMLVVIPEYKTLVNFHEEQNDPARQTPILMLGDAPAAESPLMSQDPNEPPTYLAVSDGRAAFMAKVRISFRQRKEVQETYQTLTGLHMHPQHFSLERRSFGRPREAADRTLQEG